MPRWPRWRPSLLAQPRSSGAPSGSAPHVISRSAGSRVEGADPRTNLGHGARGFLTAGGVTVLLDPGASTDLELAPPHPAHDAWIAAGDVAVTSEEEPAEPARSGGSGIRARGTVARRA